MKPAHDARGVALLTRLYAALLALYPAPFRNKFGPQMTQVFRDSCRDIWRSERITGILVFGARTLWDLCATACAERLAGGWSMSRFGWMRAGGVSIIVAACMALVTELVGWEYRRGGDILFFVQDARLGENLLFALGLAGLVAAQQTRVGRILASIVLVSVILTSVAFISPYRSPHQGAFGLGVLIIFLCYYGGLLATGVVTLITRPLPRWNIAPLIFGIWTLAQPTITTILFTGYGPGPHGAPNEATLTALYLLGSLVSTVGLWLWLGAALLSRPAPGAAVMPAGEAG